MLNSYEASVVKAKNLFNRGRQQKLSEFAEGRYDLMTTRFSGGCICGAIRYECSAEATATGKCHCRDCQRATGSAFAAAFVVPRDAISITGDVKYFDLKGDNGSLVRRGFCPVCGARLFGKSAARPDFMTS